MRTSSIENRPSPNQPEGFWEECYTQVSSIDSGATFGPLRLSSELQSIRESWQLRTQVATTAASVGLPQRTLAARFFLHVPRLLAGQSSIDGASLVEQLTEVACNWGRRVEPLQAHLRGPREIIESPLALDFGRVSDEEARIIHENFHYIGSYRPESCHFALTLPTNGANKIAALVSVSRYDLDCLRLPFEFNRDLGRVASRIFAFDWAPKGSISHLLARTIKALRQEEGAPELLVTYVNPNLGFTGASMRSSNWVFLGRDFSSTRLAYLGPKYVTERELRRLYGTSNSAELAELIPDFQMSPELEPLELWGFPISRRMRAELRSSNWRPGDFGVEQ